MPNARNSTKPRRTIVWWVLVACFVGVFLNLTRFPTLRFTYHGLNAGFLLLSCTAPLFALAIALRFTTLWGRLLGSGVALFLVLVGIALGGGTLWLLAAPLLGGYGPSKPIVHNRGQSRVVVYPVTDGVEVREERAIFPGLKVVRRVAWGNRVGPPVVELVSGDSVQITSFNESPKRYKVGRFPF